MFDRFANVVTLLLWFQIEINQTNHMHQSLRFIARRLSTAQHVSGILMSIGHAVAASGLPVVIRDTVVVFSCFQLYSLHHLTRSKALHSYLTHINQPVSLFFN
jgi:hypothetical protein